MLEHIIQEAECDDPDVEQYLKLGLDWSYLETLQSLRSSRPPRSLQNLTFAPQPEKPPKRSQHLQNR